MRITAKKPYLVFPVNYTAVLKHLEFREHGTLVYELDIPLDALHPDYEVYIPMDRFTGRDLTLHVRPEMTIPVRSAAADEAPRTDRLRPFFHYTAKQGWLNDPNGLCTIDGVYHLFYQYNPASHRWGNMHWGHATSPDLIHWTEQEPALYPDELGTMFSGSAVLDTGNRSGLGEGKKPPLLLYYTAYGGDMLSEGEKATQCLAYSTDGGNTFRKYAGNPLIPFLAKENRDPKIVYHAPSDRFIMALYLEGHEYGLFASEDLLTWQLFQVIALEEDWECPDFYPLALDGDPHKCKWVLCGAFDRYLVGEFDGYAFRAQQQVSRLHYGNASYAAQSWFTLREGDDRRVRIAWNNCPMPPAPFHGAMTFPCEMTLRSLEGKMCLCANPIREIASLYEAKSESKNCSLPFTVSLKESGYDISLVLAGEPSAVADVSVFGLTLRLDWGSGLLICADMQAPLCARDGLARVRLLLDVNGAELFLGEGEVLMTRGQILDYNLSQLMVCGTGVEARYISIASLRAVQG